MDSIYVFYDGDCIVCDTEINYYKKKANSDLINWINFRDKDFNPVNYQLQNFDFHKKLYSKKNDIFIEGVDTFILIWETLKIWQPLVMLTKIKPFRWLMNIGYDFFIVIRPYLPKRKGCDDKCQI